MQTTWVAVLGLSVWLAAGPAAAQTLLIYHIDVEQGDATLIIMPNGRTLLVDSGKNGHGGRITSAMDDAGAKQIDAFVATHYHEDHYGGIDDLVRMGVPVGRAFDRGDKDCCLPAEKKAGATFLDYQSAVGNRAIHLQRGTRIDLDPLVTVTCVSSGGVVIGEVDPKTGRDENDMSISLLVEFAGFRYFVGGDIEATTEAKIAARDLVMDVDVYQANHHGSHTSSTVEFMRDLNPSVVVVSNGSVNRYKHPRAVTLEALARLPGPPVVFQTNKCFFPQPCANVQERFIADLTPGSIAGTILIRVEAASRTYTVQYGSTTHRFTTRGTAPQLSVISLVIESMLPNPAGDDRHFEEVTLLNPGDEKQSLKGWRLRDRSGFHWDLKGSIEAGRSRTFRRNGQRMDLNNNGDDITLLDASGVERDRLSYSSAAEGEVIKRSR